jgi:hypothetical protein
MARTWQPGAPILGAILSLAPPAQAQRYAYKELHNFSGHPADGITPTRV